MSEVMDVINAFGTPLKVAWVGWVAWGIGQYFWFRHERAVPGVRRAATAAKAAVNKPAVPKPVAVQAAEAPVVGRLITPTHVAADPRVEPPSASVAPPPVVPSLAAGTAPAFDPSSAVIEQFGDAIDEGALDKFVRDFEMQDARPRRRRSRPAETPSYGGVEAPQAP
jgi:hypothetical protein